MTQTKAAELNDIAVGAAIKVTVAGQPVALVRLTADIVKAVHNICSHQHYQLAPEGWVEENSIECALHGSTFDLDSGAALCLPAVDPIPVYDCRVKDGSIWVDVDCQLNDARVPSH